MTSYTLEAADWLYLAYDMAEEVCLTHQFVTTDLLWPHVTLPTIAAGGRLMGRVVRDALHRGWMQKAKTEDGLLLFADHTDLQPVFTQDARKIRHHGPLPVYRSLTWLGFLLDGPVPEPSAYGIRPVHAVPVAPEVSEIREVN